MKKKLVFACAMLLTLMLAGAALAAALGVFGHFGNQEPYAPSAERLQKLEQAAETPNVQIGLAAPQAQESAAPQTTQEELVSHQYGRTFALTLNQAYCDGRKLYYSYTLTTNISETFRGTGKPNGIEAWDMEAPGCRYAQTWSHDKPGLDQSIAEWLDTHESAWYAYDSWDISDGVYLASGEYAMILDSASEWVDEHSLQGYQEVELPEGAPQGDTIDLVFKVMYGTGLYYQDDTGVYAAHITQPENRGILSVPVTVSRTGDTQVLTAARHFEPYSVQAELFLSDVDVSGTATLRCPEEWIADILENGAGSEADRLLNYVLVSGDTVLRNLDGSLREAAPGVLEIGLRYSLPADTGNLELRPVYTQSGEKAEEALALN